MKNESSRSKVNGTHNRLVTVFKMFFSRRDQALKVSPFA